jgi:hypothetical protein
MAHRIAGPPGLPRRGPGLRSGGLAVTAARDPADVLDEAAFDGDRGGEEQGVQRGAVEAFAGVVAVVVR